MYDIAKVKVNQVSHDLFMFYQNWGYIVQWDVISSNNNSNINNYNFYIAPTLYDTLQRFTLKLLPRTLTSNPSAARHISALSLGYGCAPR